MYYWQINLNDPEIIFFYKCTYTKNSVPQFTQVPYDTNDSLWLRDKYSGVLMYFCN